MSNMNNNLDYSLFMLKGVINKRKIKEIRKKYGMTQADFADLIEVPHSTYTSWERGVRNPSSPACSLLQIVDKYPSVFLESRREIIEGVMKYFSARDGATSATSSSATANLSVPKKGRKKLVKKPMFDKSDFSY